MVLPAARRGEGPGAAPSLGPPPRPPAACGLSVPSIPGLLGNAASGDSWKRPRRTPPSRTRPPCALQDLQGGARRSILGGLGNLGLEVRGVAGCSLRGGPERPDGPAVAGGRAPGGGGGVGGSAGQGLPRPPGIPGGQRAWRFGGLEVHRGASCAWGAPVLAGRGCVFVPRVGRTSLSGPVGTGWGPGWDELGAHGIWTPWVGQAWRGGSLIEAFPELRPRPRRGAFSRGKALSEGDSCERRRVIGSSIESAGVGGASAGAGQLSQGPGPGRRRSGEAGKAGIPGRGGSLGLPKSARTPSGQPREPPGG